MPVTPPNPRSAHARVRRAAAALVAKALVAMIAMAAAASASALDLKLSLELSATPGETGFASYYAKRFDGRRTASGTTFRNSELIAAHPSHPFGTIVRVTNLDKGRSVDVRIADRGAFHRRRRSTIIDLSREAAARLHMLAGGRARVLVEVLEWGKHKRTAKLAAQD